MDLSLQEELARIEAVHWWYQGRRRIVEDTMKRQFGIPGAVRHPGPSRSAARRILDVGCGAGEMLDMLAGFGHVTGIDGSSASVELARRRLGSRGEVQLGAIPDDLPTTGYDVVTAFDVLEHLDDDVGALLRIRRLLPYGGLFVCTVPAYMALWSPHDVRNHHRRRYSRPVLRQRLRGAGFEIVRSTYFNTWLLPPVAAVRFLKRRRTVPVVGAGEATSCESDFAMPPALVNRLLTSVFSSERFALRMCPLPAGVSILAVCRTPEKQTRPAPDAAGAT